MKLVLWRYDDSLWSFLSDELQNTKITRRTHVSRGLFFTESN
jgi:hypothetical protein